VAGKVLLVEQEIEVGGIVKQHPGPISPVRWTGRRALRLDVEQLQSWALVMGGGTKVCTGGG